MISASIKLRGRREYRLYLPKKIWLMKKELDAVLREHSRRLYYMSKKDELRLLRLRIWAHKYKVSLRYILRTLIAHYEKRITYRGKSKDGMVCSIGTLTGNGAKFILEKSIRENFPNGEHLEDWKQTRIDQILDAEKEEDLVEGTITRKRQIRIVDDKTARKFVRHYRNKVATAREEFRSAMSNKNRKLKPYRESPWR